ncbi:MAG: hypothetical protein R6V77_05855 [Candidatus Cloacimonadaceae bacterium]
MHKRILVSLVLFLFFILPCIALVYTRLYLPGYYPLLYNQVEIYKINNGQNLIKANPYLVPNLGPTSKKKVDLENKKVTISTKIGEEELYPDVIISMDKYYENMKLKVFHSTLLSKILTIQAQTTAQTGGLIKDISIDLPKIAIPKSIRRILGNKAGRLNLDGTQRITLSGTSTKRKLIPIYETNRGSRFDLQMQQDTNLRLSGTIGEKIAVNMQYNSNQDETFFDPNNINIKYTGDEDEIIQSIEAGNIGLSLSGSRYISYSTSSQGLFGIVSKLKYGPLDVTMIASKEEGQKNTMSYIGQSQADSTIIFSKNYAPRTFYYLEKPELVYNLYSDLDGPTPNGWNDNAIKITAGNWEIKNPNLLPKNGSVKVYLDDGDATNNVAAAVGDTVYVSQTESYVPYYDELIEGTDFVTNYTMGTIEILRVVDRRYTVAVRYVLQDETPVPLNSDVLDGVLHAKVIRKRNQEYSPDNPYSTWEYQMRNVYSMGITNIKKDDFMLEVYTQNIDRTRNYNVPDSVSFAGITTYNDYLRLDTSGDGRVNGDDTTVNLASGYVLIPFIKPFYPLSDTLIYQEENESISYEDFKHYISVKGKIGRDMISLGQIGILKGSVTVKVNGTTQKENSDYIVDYDMGKITFLTAAGKDPDAKIEIDYEYRSGFAVAQKSLAGIRADWNISDNTKLGSTVIYRSEKVSEKRPKIGNENIRLLMADIDGSVTWKPGFVTRLIDAVPIINTSAESRFSLSGEVALTMPNISGDSQHENEAFIDDMEGILDSYPLGLSFSTWVTGSKPWQTFLPKGRINWYNPLNIRMRHVYDEATLTDSEKDENVTVLALKVFPNTLQQPGIETMSYAGVMKYLGNQLDFSNKKYIELLVKVDKYGETLPNIVLHVDLGDINEDFYTDYGGLNVLNTEDVNSDGELTLAEDTGLDGIPDGQPGDDPNDNALFEDANADGDYPHINGTEKNNKLDTEDLDNNGVLNQLDRYLSYSVSLTNIDPAQNPYLVDYITSTKYMLLRIPLDVLSAYEIVNNSTTGVLPTLKKVSYARIWAETDRTARVLIASASVVGNKWEDFFIRYANNTIIPSTLLNSYNETYLSGIADNQKNSHYTSPPNTVYKELNQPTLEQSLTLKVDNLQPNHQVLLRQRFIDYYSLLSYAKIRYWVYPENGENSLYNDQDSLDIIIRLGADSLNYYQVRQPLKILDYHTPDGKMQESWWNSLEFELQDFSRIKDSLEIYEELVSNGRFFSYKGMPTLSNVRELVVGVLRNSTSNTPYSGTVYFNDIRVSEPFEDMGWAGRVTLNSVFADFSTLDIEFEQKSENFNPDIQRGRTQTFNFASSNTFKVMNKYFLDKFFPATWGLRLPLSLDRNYTISIPRYRANSDILRSQILDPEDKAREKNENLNYSASLGISQTTKPKSKFLEYTINKMNFNARISNTINNTATTVDTTLAWQGTYNYNLNLPENLLTFPIIKQYKLKLIPGSYTNNFTINYSSPKSYNWENRDTIRTWFPRAQIFPVKTFSTDNGFTWALTSDFNTNYRLITKRDLIQKSYFYNLNVGKESEHSQDIGVNYTPNYFPQIFTLSNSVTTRFLENQRKYTNLNQGEQEITYYKDGSSTRTIRINLTLMNSGLLSKLAIKLNSKSKKTDSDKDPESHPDEKPEDDKELLERLEKEKLEKLDKEQYEPKEDEKKEPIEGDPEYDEYLKKLAEESEEVKPEEQDSTFVEPQPDDEKKPEKPKKDFNINLPYRIVDFISRIKNVAVTYQNGFTQTYTSQNRRPNYAFQLGLPNQVPMSFLDAKGIEDTYTLSSGIAFSRRIDSTLNYSYSINKRFSNASNQIVSVTFPDLSVAISDVENLLGLSKYIQNTRFNTGYQFVLRQNGDIDWDKPKQETKTYSFNPLASITTNVAENVQTTVSVTMAKSDNITDMVTYDIVRTTNSQGLTGNVSYAFRSSQGFRVPFTQRMINIRNELTSSLAFSFEKNYDTTQGMGDQQIDRNTTRFAITPTATYQFDQNIKGGLTSGFELTSDKKRDDGTRIIRLGLWVEINL